MKAALCRVDRTLFRIELLVAGAMMLVIVAATGAGVASRYLFNNPIIWAPELSLVGQIWLTFIGSSAVFKERGHIGMSELVAVLPLRLRSVIQALVNLALCTIVLTVAWTTYGIMKIQAGQTLSTLDIPRSINSVPIVWAMGSIAFSLLVELVSGSVPPRHAASQPSLPENGTQ